MFPDSKKMKQLYVKARLLLITTFIGSQIVESSIFYYIIHKFDCPKCYGVMDAYGVKAIHRLTRLSEHCGHKPQTLQTAVKHQNVEVPGWSLPEADWLTNNSYVD